MVEEFFGGLFLKMRIFEFCRYFKMKIGRHFEKRKEKFVRKMSTWDKFKSVQEKIFETQQEKNPAGESKRGAPRKNSLRS